MPNERPEDSLPQRGDKSKGGPDRAAGRDEPRRMHTKGPTARHFHILVVAYRSTAHYSIKAQENRCLVRWASQARLAIANATTADGHTASNAPDLFRPPKLSGAGPG